MTTTARKEQIKKAIVEAFAGEPYPGDDALTLPPSNYRTEHVLRDFKGLHWRDVPRSLLEDHPPWLHLFSPAGRRFYLPAYLLVTLDQLQESSIYHRVLFTLDPPEDARWFEREYGAYTQAQRQAIRLFLEVVRDEAADQRSARPTAQEAIDRYWAREDKSAQKTASTPTRKEQVKQALREAFAEVPYPGDEGIGSDLLDWEAAAVNRDFSGYSWRDVPRDTLADHYHDLSSFFSPKGYQFFLPAYLLAALDDFHEILDPVIYGLTPSEDEDMSDWFRSRNDLLTSTQKHAVCLFLEYVRDETDKESLGIYCRIALDKYWAKEEHRVREAAADRPSNERLKQTILDAFADVSYPGDDEIMWKGSPSNHKELEQDFRGRHFRDVPREVLIRHDRDIYAFSDEGTHFVTVHGPDSA
jgi:hypothetical protein